MCIRDSLKTSFALTMGQLLARNERVLYINLEEYSGFTRLIQARHEQDLSDVLYLYRQGAYNWLKLKSIVYSWGGMDYIPPVRYAEDLNPVSYTHLTKMKLNEKIIEYDSYDFVLIPPRIRHILYESDYDIFDNYVIWFELSDRKLLLEDQIIKLHDYDGAVQFLCAEIYKSYMKTGMADAGLLNIYLEAVLWHMKKGLILGTGQALSLIHIYLPSITDTLRTFGTCRPGRSSTRAVQRASFRTSALGNPSQNSLMRCV